MGNSVGYSDQGFFSSVTDGSSAVRGSADGSQSGSVMTGSFLKALYGLRVSLTKVTDSMIYRYPYTLGDGDRYTLSVSCPDADASALTIAGILGIDLAGAIPPGDVNSDLTVTLADAILILQMLSGMDMTGKTIILQADANGDHRIGIAEVIFILQKAAGLRLP